MDSCGMPFKFCDRWSFLRILIANYLDDDGFTYHCLSGETDSTWRIYAGILYPDYNDTVESVSGI